MLQKSGPKISAILPVYNEEKTVAFVVKVLLSSKLLDEIICVNDGSTDNTLKILKSFGKKIKIIDVKPNKGKGNAMVQGVKAAKGEVVAFFDGDYVSFSTQNVDDLVRPFKEDSQIRIVLGLRPVIKNGNVLQGLNGERAYYKKDLKKLLSLKVWAESRFGAEVYLNTLNKKFEKYQIKKVKLQNLVVKLKHGKTSPRTAIKDYAKETMEIVKQLAKHRKYQLYSIKEKIYNLRDNYLDF